MDDYPNDVIVVLDAKKIKVQHHPQSLVQQEQAEEGTAENSTPGQVDDAMTTGAGHSDD
jgi:hypothetical protein